MTHAVHAFAGAAGPAEALAAALGLPCRPIQVDHFPDGESLVTVGPASGCALLYCSLDRPDAKIVQLVLAAAALRDGGARRVVLVAPYLAYMRQDMAFAPGQAVSQRVIGALLAGHFDAVLTVDPHLHRVSSLAEVMPGTQAVSISAAPALAGAIDRAANPVLVGPDAESRPWVEAVARSMGLEVLVGNKQRRGDREVVVTFAEAARVAGRAVVLVDDVISSGATLARAAEELLAAGAARVEALATHCLAGAADLAALHEAGIARIRSCNSVPGPTAVIPLAELLAQAITGQGWLERSNYA
jgi:ribose-phosphate pyrophosphokinase